MIIDASVAIDAIADSGRRGISARETLGSLPASEALIAPGHFAIEILSGFNALATRPASSFHVDEIAPALADAADLGVTIEATPWEDVARAWDLAQQSLTYADAIYVAAAERHRTALLTSDARLERSGAGFNCPVIVIPTR